MGSQEIKENSKKQKINQGSQLTDFVRIFDVEPTVGNRGQLLLRKDSVKMNNKESLALTATVFFACGFCHGASIKVETMQELEKAFHKFNQEDADAISRHSLKEVTMYLDKIHNDDEVDVKIKQLHTS